MEPGIPLQIRFSKIVAILFVRFSRVVAILFVRFLGSRKSFRPDFRFSSSGVTRARWLGAANTLFQVSRNSFVWTLGSRKSCRLSDGAIPEDDHGNYGNSLANPFFQSSRNSFRAILG